MAERVGFEPTIPVKVCPLSRRIVSTTHAPLRVGNWSRDPWLRSAAYRTFAILLAFDREWLSPNLSRFRRWLRDGPGRMSGRFPHIVRRALRCTLPPGDSTARGRAGLRPSAPPRLWGRRRRTRDAECGHAPRLRHTWRTVQL